MIPDVVFPFMTCVSPRAPPTASRAPLLVDLQAHAGDFSEEGVENHRRRACYFVKQQQKDPINGFNDQAQFAKLIIISGTSARSSDRSNNTSHNAHKLADTNLLTFTRTHTHTLQRIAHISQQSLARYLHAFSSFHFHPSLVANRTGEQEGLLRRAQLVYFRQALQ